MPRNWWTFWLGKTCNYSHGSSLPTGLDAARGSCIHRPFLVAFLVQTESLIASEYYCSMTLHIYPIKHPRHLFFCQTSCWASVILYKFLFGRKLEKFLASLTFIHSSLFLVLCVDALWACHAILLVGEEECVMSPNGREVGRRAVQKMLRGK